MQIDGLSPAFFSLIGAVIGATIAALSQYLSGRQNRKNIILEIQIDEYFKTLSLSTKLKELIIKFGNASSGRMEPTEDSSDEEKEIATRKDNEAAEAVDNLFKTSELLKNQTYRIAALGERKVRKKADLVNERIDEYIEWFANQVASNGVFVWDDHSKLTMELESSIEPLSSSIRKSLGIK